MTAPRQFIVGDTVEDREGDISVITLIQHDGTIRTDRGWAYVATDIQLIKPAERDEEPDA